MRQISAAETPVPPKALLVGVFSGLLAALIWGAWPVVSRLGLEQTLTAIDITALRFGIAGMILLPWVWRRGTAGLGWPRALVLAGGAGVPYVLVTVQGLSYAPAGHAGVIVPSCMLTFSTLGGWLLLGDRPSPTRLAGLAVILAGVLLIGWSGLTGAGLTRFDSGVWRGDLMFVASGALWASYTVASRAWSADPLQATALVSVISMVIALPATLAFGRSGLLSAPLSDLILQGLFQGVMAAILALVFYTRAVAILGAARGAVFAALVPAVAVLLAYPVLGEVPGALDLLGVAAVSAGMLGSLYQRSSKMTASLRSSAHLPPDQVRGT